MRARRYIHLFIDLMLMFMALFMLVSVWNFYKDYKNIIVIRLDHEIPYDADMEKLLETLKQESLQCTFWREDHNTDVLNKEFMRSEKVDTIGIAGDSGYLFPHGNVLGSGENGFCILGCNTADKLFGSTNVIGRKVELDGNSYSVAGIEYTKKNLCMYELNKMNVKDIQYAVIYYENKAEKQMQIQRIENLSGITGEKYITEQMWGVIQPKLYQFLFSLVILLTAGIDLMRFLWKK